MESLIPTEFVRVIVRGNLTFEAYARDSLGKTLHLCVKPQILSRAEESGGRLLGEWLGYKIAESINLPTPPYGLINLTREFLDSTGGQLADARAGTAFWCEWQEGKFEFPFMPSRSAIANPESVAGVTVLDTVQFNNDRREDNLLVLPDFDASGEKFLLMYIDNGWLAWGQFRQSGTLPAAMLPQSYAMRSIVQNELEFGSYFVMVEGLDREVLAKHLELAPLQEWADPAIPPSEVPEEAVWRGSQTRTVVTRVMDRFPSIDLNC
jgi:hypothetical protein